MTTLEAIQARHSVRSYDSRSIPEDIVNSLNTLIHQCNQEANLHIQLVTEEGQAFRTPLNHYGLFRGVRNYLAMVGTPSSELDEKLGYHGEKIVIEAQRLGLNSCWVGLTAKMGVVKKNISLNPGEKLVCVIALGYGDTQGKPHRSKPLAKVCEAGQQPEWFQKGMEAVLLAPTAVNQQKFFFQRSGNHVTARCTGRGLALVDLGIVKYHFEVGAGIDNFYWDRA